MKSVSVITSAADGVATQKNIDVTQATHFAAYHEMADIPVTFKTLEEEFLSRLSLVEDLHKRFNFMMSELKSAGLRTEE